ncbi:ABC transporter permease [Streptomyces cyaneochromogenes]|uniref:ABC transporter permease n=1 Tax=Streptomyces cyaneochromogenes TaxID=2496836 RepID=UPI001E39ED8F|nr:FtsX-like permease family protein [Streptomyces cyaneochromogenes]
MPASAAARSPPFCRHWRSRSDAPPHAEVHRYDRYDRNNRADYTGLSVLAAKADPLSLINGRVAAGRFLDRGSGRRALGASRGQIRLQFLTESVVLSTLGGLAGTAFGVLSAPAYAAFHHRPVFVPLPALAAGPSATALIGALADVHPSVRASRLHGPLPHPVG